MVVITLVPFVPAFQPDFYRSGSGFGGRRSGFEEGLVSDGEFVN